MKNKKLIAEQLRRLIIHRNDVYGRQKKKSGWQGNIEKPITDDLILRHLKGEVTIGTYSLDTKNTVKVLCFDIDKLPDNQEGARKFVSFLKYQYRIKARVEFSGGLENGTNKHYHVWVFLKPDTPAKKAKLFGEYVRSKLGFKDYEVEVNPKNEAIIDEKGNKIKEGVGSLVKLPLGINLKTGKRSRFVSSRSFKPKKSLKFLKSIVLVSLPDIELHKEEMEPAKKHLLSEPNGKGEKRMEYYLPKLKFCERYAYHTRVQLNGEPGDNFRTHAAWDMIIKGFPEDIIYDYFKKQQDFNRDIIMEKVNYAMKKIRKGKLRGDNVKSTRCSVMKKKCGHIVYPICKTCTEAKEIENRLSRGEKLRNILEDLNIRELTPIWEDIEQHGINRDRGKFIDIIPDVLDKIIEYYHANPNECRIKWRNSGFLVSEGERTTCTARVSGKTCRVVRFNTNKVESFLKLR